MTALVPVVAADVGNTSVGLAVRINDTIQSCSIPIRDQSDWADQVVDWAGACLPNASPLWRIASVHPKACDQLTEILDRKGQGSRVQHLSWRDVPMKARVESPDRLGIDRLLSAYGASRIVGASFVVIDAGTAITVDWVDETGDFRGGAILPGIRMQLRSLSSGTSALPKIDWDTTEIEGPRVNTERAMITGVFAGVAGGIDRLIHAYRDFAGHPTNGVRVVLTGGDGAAISPHLSHNHEQHRNLVCRAVLDLPRSEVD